MRLHTPECPLALPEAGSTVSRSPEELLTELRRVLLTKAQPDP